jgi:hypothetical protein
VIRGRPVVRIRVDQSIDGSLGPVADFYVDAHTYRPARIVILSDRLVLSDRGRLPLACLSSLIPNACGAFRGWVYDFVEYRELPGTPANRKLADIRAMHPHAKVL